jgi:hypothetical protein
MVWLHLIFTPRARTAEATSNVQDSRGGVGDVAGNRKGTASSVATDRPRISVVVREDLFHGVDGHVTPVGGDQFSNAIQAGHRIWCVAILMGRKLVTDIVVGVQALAGLRVIEDGDSFGSDLHVRNPTLAIAEDHIASATRAVLAQYLNAFTDIAHFEAAAFQRIVRQASLKWCIA